MLALCLIAAMTFVFCFAACAEDGADEHLFVIRIDVPLYGLEEGYYDIDALSGTLVYCLTSDEMDKLPADLRSDLRNCFTERVSFSGYNTLEDGSRVYLVSGYSEKYLVVFYYYAAGSYAIVVIDDFSDLYALLKSEDDAMKSDPDWVDDGMDHDLVRTFMTIQFIKATEDMHFVDPENVINGVYVLGIIRSNN